MADNDGMESKYLNLLLLRLEKFIVVCLFEKLNVLIRTLI